MKVVPLEQPGVLEHFKPLCVNWRQLRCRSALQLGNLRLDLLPGDQVFPSQLSQLRPAQARSLAELDQLVIIGL